jgi:hypothetical protein
MTGRHEARPLRARGLLALACGVALLWSATPAAHAEPAAGAQNVPMIHRLLDPLEQFLVPKCITPAVDRVFNDLVAARAFQPVLGDGFTLERVEAHVDQIELEIQDGTHRQYGITLALTSKSGKPDGQGRQFLFYLVASPSSPNLQAKTALLALASLLDEAIPETALVRCSGEAHEARGAPFAERRYPRALALASALAEVMVLLTAVIFGLRAVRPRGGLTDGDS